MATSISTPLIAPSGEFDSTFVTAAKSELANSGLVRIAHFPSTAHAFVGFLAAFGDPLPYYGDDAGTHPDHPAIWRVRYEPQAAERGEIHAMAGPLEPHSSQSLRWPRPPFFSMLMVSSGWQDRPEGYNGETLVVRWSDAVQLMRSDPAGAAAVRNLFTDVPFPDGIHRSIAYRLTNAADADDVGIRIKSGLLDHLRSTAARHPATSALKRLSEAAAQVATRVTLRSGDLLLLDNNRWGHGRESVIGYEIDVGGAVKLNPRELWSATVG
ncbi:TauD/TfdA family dioxygenase [Labedaea rhizosphaerae]|uniref:TfdA family taurine catabolism dioxygenase TauD n=1 Tax=Labedaea rhizosphaerae TaxID=598644 RepID=A0A4R6SG11_LABRH|nr:TauD/TfdA family dioxygenase [Labedaea rhizosphaerae]TDQ00584.1 TfdA family taurine catabolism dioxygenase TauD [Labedaea rhizosphaerae]